MPRKGRGGRRQGTQGAAYSNRTDLNSDPIRVPAPSPRQAPTPPPAAATSATPTQQAAGGGTPLPPVIPLDAPTQQPGMPITSGLSSGPGAGPESLAMLQNQSQQFARLARYLPVLELAASRPGASQAARDLVRRIRGSAPVGGV